MRKMRKIYLILMSFVLFMPVVVVAATKLDNPLNANSFTDLVTDIVTKFVVPVGGVVVVFFIIYAGFLFVKAQGNPTKIEEAKKVFLWVIIGSAILLGASVLATIVENTIKSLK